MGQETHFFSDLYKSQNAWMRASSVNFRVTNDFEIMGEFLNLESVNNEDCVDEGLWWFFPPSQITVG